MNSNPIQPRLLNIVNSAIAIGFLRGQLQYFQDKGFDVAALSPEKRLNQWEVSDTDGVQIIEVPMERRISPLQDCLCLWNLWRVMCAWKPHITNVGMPKAGLLGGLAAWLNRVPCRFYTLHGLRYESASGLKRRILIYLEWVTCRLAHRIICVSPSVREKAIAAGLTTEEQSVVFGSGSCNGLDASRFAVTPQVAGRAAELRCELKIPEESPVVAFVGRFTRDKGIPELAEAFRQLHERLPDVRLLMVGCFEDEYPLPCDVRRYLETHPRVVFAGVTENPAPYYAMADVLVLPSHREGMPTVVLEAHAAGKPVVATAVTGIVDAVVDGETGLLVPMGDLTALADALATLLTNKSWAASMGRAGQERVNREFRQEQVWEALYREYQKSLQVKQLPLPTIPVAEPSGEFASQNVASGN